jgi:hypothetical protein
MTILFKLAGWRVCLDESAIVQGSVYVGMRMRGSLSYRIQLIKLGGTADFEISSQEENRAFSSWDFSFCPNKKLKRL